MKKKTMQLISPRKVEHWSQTYKVRFAKLELQGLAHQSGVNAVLASKESGLWNFMDDVDNLIIPQDFQIELAKSKVAKNYFEAFSPSNKRFVLRYIKLAKTTTTRNKRILQVVALASQHKKIPGL